MKSPIAVVVLAAGAGTRMKSALPKVLHPLAGWPMVRHVLENVRRLKPDRIVGVVGPGASAVAAAFAPHPTVVQRQPHGTGDAAKAALPALAGHCGPVLVVYADAPLITTATLRRLVEKCRKTRAAVGVLGFVARDPAPYGRLIVKDGLLERIVESRDADTAEKAIDFCNSGVMCLDGSRLAALLGAIKNNNAKKEFYLTDAVALARAAGLATIAVDGEEEEFQGVNSRAELAVAEKALQRRLRAEGTGTEIKAFCDIEGARIGRRAIIGPFARIRPGSEVADEVHIGNFVELKATRMARGAKANHLAYIGDSDVGAASNIGAGTIAVNYDGFGKWRTEIGADVFVGSNSSLIAPVRIGRGANVTAGSVITEDVPAGAVAFGRARQVTKERRAAPLRAKLKDRAAAAKRANKK